MKETLLQLCQEKMVKKNLLGEIYEERLKEETKEIDNQGENEYFLELHEKGVKFPRNEHNLLIPYLLDVVEEFDIDKSPSYWQDEFPDIDVDYLPQVRDYLKNDWAVETFGADKVCNIGNYTTFGIKSSLIDMARVHGYDRDEILKLTTQLGLKDNDGEVLTWDKALEMYPDLQKYLEEHPEVADSAQRLLHRNRGMGMHAGGLIISKSPIDELVPLIRGKDNTHASAWTEGLHSQDLGPVGLVKFDLLVITDLLRIVTINKLIKDRHGLDSICAFPGQSDWSDTSYLNDPASLSLANEGRLKGIFQFDSHGIRRLCKDGSVTGFDDLVAYSALYRPGPLNMKMHEHYIERKRGFKPEWKKEVPERIMPILKRTYGVMVFQEQVMQILNAVGDIPLIHCEKIRKAMSKKKVEQFRKYKKQFIERGQVNLGWNQEQLEHLWDQIEAFSGYGFNKSHSVAYTYISSRLLWQKAHYPLEFFAGTLQCVSDDKKVKEYKLDAQRFGFELKRIDLEKSKVNFNIVGKDIYIGFKNVKGIGKEVAEEIVACQPYKEIAGSKATDFLTRFGTDAKVLKPLISLGAFEGSDNARLYQFYEYFKKMTKRREERTKRHGQSKVGHVENLQEAWNEGDPPDPGSVDQGWESNIPGEEALQQWVLEIVGMEQKAMEAVELEAGTFRDEFNLGVDKIHDKVVEKVEKSRAKCLESGEELEKTKEEEVCQLMDEEKLKLRRKIDRLRTITLKEAEQRFYAEKKTGEWRSQDCKEIWNIFKKYRRSVEGFIKKTNEDEPITLDTLDEYEVKELDEEMKHLLSYQLDAEIKHYGFGWDHPIEGSLEYEEGKTFYQFDEDETKGVFPVQVQVVKPPEKKVSKSKKKTVYYTVRVQDADFQEETVVFWEDDYVRFAEELNVWYGDSIKGNFLSLRLTRPGPGFHSYTFEAPPRRYRHKEIPEDKSKDYRLIVIARPEGEVIPDDSTKDDDPPEIVFEVIEL